LLVACAYDCKCRREKGINWAGPVSDAEERTRKEGRKEEEDYADDDDDDSEDLIRTYLMQNQSPAMPCMRCYSTKRIPFFVISIGCECFGLSPLSHLSRCVVCLI